MQNSSKGSTPAGHTLIRGWNGKIPGWNGTFTGWDGAIPGFSGAGTRPLPPGFLPLAPLPGAGVAPA